MNIKTIASGSSGNCYVIESEGQRLLIECGVSVAEIRLELNFDLSSVVGCLVSHEHRDHCKAAKELAERTSVHMYGPKSVRDALGITVYNVMTENYHMIAPFLIKPCLVEHDGEMECFAYLIIVNDDDILFYISDAAAVPFVISPITHLMIETNHSFAKLTESSMDPVLRQRIWNTHIDIDSAVRFARDHRDSLKEVHLLHLSDKHSDEELFARRMREAVGVPVYIAGGEHVEA